MSKAEEVFQNYWDSRGYQKLFKFEREYRFLQTRRFRIDFANLEYKLAVEVQGHGSYAHGGSAKSLSSDIEKHQALALLGWKYFPIAASAITKDVDIAVEPLIEWINKYTNKQIKVGW